jgi:hypothetical protein
MFQQLINKENGNGKLVNPQIKKIIYESTCESMRKKEAYWEKKKMEQIILRNIK